MKIVNKAKARAARFLRLESGVAVIELAFATPFLVALAIGMTDFGLAWSRQMQLANAVRAGTQYVVVRKPNIVGSGVQTDSSNPELALVKAAALTAAPGDFAGTSDITLYFDCPDNTAVVTSTTVCDNGENRHVLVQVAIDEDYEMLFNYPGIGGTIELGDERTVRLN